MTTPDYKKTLLIIVLTGIVLFVCSVCLPAGLEDLIPGDDPDSDDDGDTLSLSYEMELGTDPLVANPNVLYALEHELSAYVDKIKIYDEDGVQSEEERFNIDLVSSIVHKSILADAEEIHAVRERNIDYILSDNGAGIKQLHAQLTEVSQPALEKILALGLDDEVIDYVSYVLSLKNEEPSYVKDVLENGWCFEDHKLEDYEKEYLAAPDGEFQEVVFNHYLSGIESLNPLLAGELEKLPDFAQVDRKNVEALEDILDLAQSGSVFGTSFESILNEGIVEKRKYCSPLEALVWILYDEDNENLSMAIPSYKLSGGPSEYLLFNDVNLVKLVSYSYDTSTISSGYDSVKWDDYDMVVDRLNSPLIIKAAYKALHIRYTPRAGDARSPGMVFESREGDCDDQARLWTFCLFKNGYEFDNFEDNETNAICTLTIEWKDVRVDKETELASKGHGTTLLKMNGFFWVYEYGHTEGPYSDIYEVCNWFTEMAEEEWIFYRLYDVDWEKSKPVPNPKW